MVLEHRSGTGVAPLPIPGGKRKIKDGPRVAFAGGGRSGHDPGRGREGGDTHLADEHDVLVPPHRVGRRLPELGQRVMVERVLQAQDDGAGQDAAAQHEEHAQEGVDAQRRGLPEVGRLQLAVHARQVAEPSALQDVHEPVVDVAGHGAGHLFLSGRQNNDDNELKETPITPGPGPGRGRNERHRQIPSGGFSRFQRPVSPCQITRSFTVVSAPSRAIGPKSANQCRHPSR